MVSVQLLLELLPCPLLVIDHVPQLFIERHPFLPQVAFDCGVYHSNTLQTMTSFLTKLLVSTMAPRTPEVHRFRSTRPPQLFHAICAIWPRLCPANGPTCFSMPPNLSWTQFPQEGREKKGQKIKMNQVLHGLLPLDLRTLSLSESGIPHRPYWINSNSVSQLCVLSRGVHSPIL